MATRTGIDASIVNRLGADHQELFFAIKAEFDTDTISMWTGSDDLVFGGVTYTGAGGLLSVSGSEDSVELKSSGLTISISGMDDTVLNYALTENYQNRFLTMYMGYLMGGSNEVAGTIIIYKGRMTSIGISDDPNGSTINVATENRLTDLNRPSNYRYTKESQDFLAGGTTDKGFDRVNLIQDKEIFWGKATERWAPPGTDEDTIPRHVR